MKKLFPLMVLLLATAGCATTVNPVPDGYAGGVAVITDSSVAQGRSKAHVYYLQAVNGKQIETAEGNNRNASANKGPFKLTLAGASRQVPAQPLAMRLVGTVQHAAPIGALFSSGSNYRVEGDIQFTPQSGQSYVVAGQLGKNYSAVWLEDNAGNIVSALVEEKGENFNPEYDGLARSPRRIGGSELSRAEVFLRIRSGETDDFVVSKLGEPNRQSNADSGFMSDKPSTITYHYDGLGDVVFLKPNIGLFRKPGSEPNVVDRVVPELTAQGGADSVRAQFAAAHGLGLQKLAKDYFAQSGHSVDVLDAFADEIWRMSRLEGRFEVDSAAFLCKTLGKSQNPRYASLLQRVADTAVSKKLRRYASSSLEQLPPGQVQQYLPGNG